MTTTKSDLVNAVAEANGFPQNRSTEIVEILIDLIKTQLSAGEDVLISDSVNSASRRSESGEVGIRQPERT